MSKGSRKFLEKLHTDIAASGRASVIYDGCLSSMRATSTKVHLINQRNLVGVYNARSSDADIIDDCLWFIEKYDKEQIEQSRVLDQKMGVANEKGAS